MENKVNIDKENLKQVIEDFWKQFQIGQEIAENIKCEGNFASITVSGMGGSALPSDILITYLESEGKRSFPIFQNRTYKLPGEAYKNSLNFFISYSGNTEETISALEEAIKNNLPSIGFTTGGKLEEICKKNNVPFVKIPAGIQPRYATGYFFSSMLKVLTNCGLLSINLEEILSSTKKLNEFTKEFENQGKAIAEKLNGKTPIIYTTDKFKALAMVIKIKINENAKTPAFWNYFPELNHNEMVGFTLPQSEFHVVSLIDRGENEQNLKRISITADLFKEKGIGTTSHEIQGENYFLKIFSTLILGDWISYYLALSYNQDPTPVNMVEDLKKRLQ